MLDLVISVVLAVVNGMIWYSPSVFGNVWAANAWPGKSLEWISQSQTNLEGIFAVSILSHGAVMLMFKILTREIRPLRFAEYITLAGVVGILLLASRLVHLPFEQITLVHILISTGYDVTNLFLSSLVQYALRK